MGLQYSMVLCAFIPKGSEDVQKDQNNYMGHLILAQIYAYQDRIKEAQYHSSELRRIAPWYSIKFEASSWLFSDKEAIQPTLELLRKAGIPEG